VAFDAGNRVNDNSGSHQVPSLIARSGRFAFLDPLLDQLVLTNIGQNGVPGDADSRGRTNRQANLVGGGLNAKARERRQVPVEGAIVQKRASLQPMQPCPDWMGS